MGAPEVLQLLFGFRAPVGRRAYATAGFSLMSLKFAGDWVITRLYAEHTLATLPSGWVYFDDASGGCKRRRLQGGDAEECPADKRSAPDLFQLLSRSLDAGAPWTVSVGDYGTFSARHIDGRSLGASLQTQTISWRATYATLLHGGVVLFQLGNQIVVLDLERGVIAPFGEGRRPWVEPE